MSVCVCARAPHTQYFFTISSSRRNPNGPHPVLPEWPVYDTTDQTSQHLSVDVIAPRLRNRAKRTQLWLDVVPMLTKVQDDLHQLFREQGERCEDSASGSAPLSLQNWVQLCTLLFMAVGGWRMT